MSYTSSNLGSLLDRNKKLPKIKEIQINDSFSTTNTRLADFIAKTSLTDIASNIIDPLTTFDVEFEFYPINTVLKTISLNFKNTKSGIQKDDQENKNLILNLGYFVQAMTLPQMVMPEAGKVPTLFGEFPVNNLYVKPDNNTFTLTMLNTKISLHDFLFYPWMREVTLPRWSYESQPYTTAKVTVKFDKHCNTRYVFVGCRPTQISSRQANQEPEGEVTRDITMLFDYMFITESDEQAFATNKYDYGKLSAIQGIYSDNWYCLNLLQ